VHWYMRYTGIIILNWYAMYQYILGQYIMYRYILGASILYTMPIYYPGILNTIPALLLGYYVLSHNMYQYMPETWTLRGTPKGNFRCGD